MAARERRTLRASTSGDTLRITVKAVAALLVALFALTSSIGVRGPFGVCRTALAQCDAKPCCKPHEQDTPAIRAKMACCEVAHTVEHQPTPAVPHDQQPYVLVATRTLSAHEWSAPARLVRPRPLLAPRGPPLYLRNRSLLL